jgi:hypothetical protein
MGGFTLLQLDSGRGLRSSLCPLQASSATADTGGRVAADMLRNESKSNLDNGVAARMILLRQ